MDNTERTDRTALPLAVAAARLGITPDALRMRVRRGKAQGFKRDGRAFVYLTEQANKTVRPEPGLSEQPSAEGGIAEPSPAQAPAPGQAGRRSGRGRPRADRAADRALPVIVEFQKVELDRLLRDNARLNARVDRLMEEIRHLREMQQREQVLRQQEQNLRQQSQATLDRLTERLGLPQARSAAALAGPGARDMASVAAGDVESGIDIAAGPGRTGDRGHSAPEAPKRVAPKPVAPRPVADLAGDPGEARAPAGAGSADSIGSAPGPELEAEAVSGGAGTGVEDAAAADLAEILKELGQSLREPEIASPPRSPPAPRPAPPPAAAADPQTGAGKRAPSAPPAAASAERFREIPETEQAALVDILGRMGPAAEDRRSAARILKRLFRSRNGSRDRES